MLSWIEKGLLWHAITTSFAPSMLRVQSPRRRRAKSSWRLLPAACSRTLLAILMPVKTPSRAGRGGPSVCGACRALSMQNPVAACPPIRRISPAVDARAKPRACCSRVPVRLRSTLHGFRDGKCGAAAPRARPCRLSAWGSGDAGFVVRRAGWGGRTGDKRDRAWLANELEHVTSGAFNGRGKGMMMQRGNVPEQVFG